MLNLMDGSLRVRRTLPRRGRGSRTANLKCSEGLFKIWILWKITPKSIY